MKKEPLEIMVLGVGGNVSQGILKALALSPIKHKITGGCVSHLAAGLFTVDRAYLTPRADDPSFIDWLITICRKEKTDAIFSGVEPVLSVLSEHSETIRKETGAISIVSEPTHLKTGGDKLETCEWLKEHGFNYPLYAAIEDTAQINKLIETCGYPLIAKPRKGKSGYGIIEIHNERDMEFVTGKKGYVVQELLGTMDEEYTAGCFSDKDGKVRGVIVMRRELQQGTTYRAITGKFPDVRAEAERIAAALKPKGPCNIQMRMSKDRPVAFEINMRFSGTTPIRARMGFNEVHEALNHFVLGNPATDLPEITSGIALRYWNEIYIEQQAANLLEQTGSLNNPRDFRSLIEDYGRTQ